MFLHKFHHLLLLRLKVIQRQ